MSSINLDVEPSGLAESLQGADSVAQVARGLSLRANFAWTMIGNVVYAGCQWAMLAVLARLGNPEMIGRFALALAITAPIMLFANLQLRNVQATDARHEYSFADYFGLRLLTSALALLVIAGLVLVAGYPPEAALIILVVGLAKAFEAVSDVFYGLLQQREQMDRIAISRIIKGVLSLGALASGVYLTGSLLWGVVGLAAAWLLILVTYDMRAVVQVLTTRSDMTLRPEEGGQVESMRPRWDLGKLKKLAWLTLPLGFVALLISLIPNIPVYFIAQYLGLHELGIYSTLAYLMVAGNTVVGALGQSASPRLAKYYAGGDIGKFRALLLKLLGIGTLLGGLGVAVAFAAGRPILAMIYTPEYAEYVSLLVWLMVVGGLGYVATFLAYSMTATRNIPIQLPIYAAVSCVVAAGSFLLIPTYGLVGAAWAMSVAFAAQVVGSLVVNRRALDRAAISRAR